MEDTYIRYQQLLQQRRESPDGNLPPLDHYELLILDALHNPDAQYDDLEDIANLTRALAKVQDRLQQEVIHHYYKT